MEWAQAVTAISTAIIALLLIVPAVASVLFLGELRRATKATQTFIEGLNRDVGPAIQAARNAVDQGRELVGTVRGEVEQIVGTSRDLRQRLVGAANATEERLRELETLLDVLQAEVEDTVLDVAAALRTTRRGASVFAAVKKALFRRRR